MLNENILVIGCAMQNTALSPTEKTLDPDALFLTSLILQDVHETIRDIQTIVAVLLRYVLISVSITDGLIGLIAPTQPEEN